MSQGEAQKLFGQLFGDRLERVLGTPQAADDVELAKQMLDVASASGEDARLLGLVLDYARKLAAKSPAGYATAVEASRQLMEKWPDERGEILDGLLEVRRRQYAVARGEEKTEIGRAWLEEMLESAAVRADVGRWNEVIALDVQAAGLATRLDPDRKPAAMSHMKIEVLDMRGNIVASSGPHNQGNVWCEFRLQVPRSRALRRFVLHLYNGASTWYDVDTIQLR